jgi:hypothetical protein
MKSEARSAAGRAAWAAKSPAEKARIRARLTAGRNNAEAVRGNLTNWETRQLSGLVKPKATKSSKRSGSKSAPKASAPKTVKTTSRKAPVSSKKRTPAQLANDQRLRDMAKARAAGSKRPRNAPASSPKAAASSGTRSAAQLANDKRLGALARKRAAERRAGAETIEEAHDRLASGRSNLTPKERKRIERVLRASANKRSAAARRRKTNASRKAAGQPPLKSSKRRRKSSRKARPNAYIARPNAYIATRANGETPERDNRSRRRRSRKGARRNMYIRRNPGLEMAKKALILTGLGVGSFMVTNVVHHYVNQLEFAEGPIADYGVPAALTALVWFGPTGKFLANNKMIGKHGQIALTAGIVGAVANRMLDGIVTNNLAKIPVIGEHASKVLLGWPIISEADLALPVGTSGVGEYVYDLPDDGMGEYVRDPSRLSVEREMKGLAYVDLEQRAANEAALQAANLKVLQPEIDNSRSQFDDQFDSAY